MEYNKPLVIAEIGCNHKGNFNIAVEMIETAVKYCKADAVKFQKRNNKLLLTEKEYNAPHPVPENSYGNTYGEHRETLEFTIDQHAGLKKYCESIGGIYSCSVWDIDSTKEIVSLNPNFIKIPSAQNTNFEIFDYLIKNYKHKIHISLGMTKINEIEAIYSFFKKNNRLSDIVFYACTSGYPVPFNDICLLEILNLKNGLNLKSGIGFSGHHLGIAPDIAAYVLGAVCFERHFTLDRTWKGTDHAASLEPTGLMKLKRDLINVWQSLTYKSSEILPIEEIQRKKLKYKGV